MSDLAVLFPDGSFTGVLVTSYLAFGKEGKVYRAELRDTHQPVAIKCIERWEKQIVSLRKTLDFCKKLEHPNIVRHLHHQSCRAINPLEPPVYMVMMELCKGGTLRHAVRRTVVSPYLLQKWTKEIIEGLAYLHEKRCVHRDLKGENILMTSRNPATSSVKIADLSTVATSDDTFPGCGTYPFMAPEMIADRDPEKGTVLTRSGRPADIWSLGCVVIEMLNGTSPQFFREHSDENLQVTGENAVLYFVLNGGSPAIPAGLPLDIDNFIRGCLKRDPCERKNAVELKTHAFLTCPTSTVSNWILPEPCGEIQEPAELQEFSASPQGIIPIQLKRPISVGAQDKVYLAERIDTRDIIAVKKILLDTDSVIRERQLKRLKAKFQVLMALHHPHIIRHIHLQEAPIITACDGPTCQNLMELCEGPTLEDLVQKSRVPWPFLQKWTKQLVDGLSYIHSQHCVHRNIASQNILLSSNDVHTCLVKIGGFGATKRLQGASTGQTEVSGGRGTAQYMSPEMITGGRMTNGNPRRLGRKTDIWSLGCVVIEMVMGKRPDYYRKRPGRMDKAIGDLAVMHFVVAGGAPTVLEGLPAKADSFIMQCIQRKPNDRPCAADLKKHDFLTANKEEVSHWKPPSRSLNADLFYDVRLPFRKDASESR